MFNGENHSPPSNHICKERKQLIQQLVKKQTNIKFNLKREISEPKIFESNNIVTDLPVSTSGTKTLQEFTECLEKQYKIADLQSAGLTQTEIDLYFELAKQQNASSTKETLNDNQKFTFSDITFTEKLKLKVIAYKIENHFKTVGDAEKQIPPSILHHPIDHINDIEKNLFDNLLNDVPSYEKRRKTMKKYESKLEKLEISLVPVLHQTVKRKNRKSKWDQI